MQSKIFGTIENCVSHGADRGSSRLLGLKIPDMGCSCNLPVMWLCNLIQIEIADAHEF